MDQPTRYYLTTAIAYPNNSPGLHTLYEVIGADVIARWHRMSGDDTRFLTGTDEHSVNIARAGAELSKDTRDFVDEMVALFRDAEDALGIAPDRFIRTTDPDHRRASQEMVRRAYANGDVYLGNYEGWYCPNEGFRNVSDLVEDARRASTARTTPTSRCSGSPSATGSSACRPTRSGWRALRGAPRLGPAGIPQERDARLHPPGARGHLDQPRDLPLGHPVSDRARRRDRAARGRLVGSRGGRHLRLVRRADQLHHGRRLPRRPGRVREVVAGRPARIGKDINRFHTIIWPAMLMSAGIELPRQVWVHGFLLAAGGDRMCKSRGNLFDPVDAVNALGADGARFVTLREVPFDRDTDVSWDSFVRRYNADLANDYGNLLNRTLSMTGRYLEGERPPVARHGELARAWVTTFQRYGDHLQACLLHEALADLWALRGRCEPLRRRAATVDAGEAGEGWRRGRVHPAPARPQRIAGGEPRPRAVRRTLHAQRGQGSHGAARARRSRTVPTAMVGRRSPISCAGAVANRTAGSARPHRCSRASNWRPPSNRLSRQSELSRAFRALPYPRDQARSRMDRRSRSAGSSSVRRASAGSRARGRTRARARACRDALEDVRVDAISSSVSTNVKSCLLKTVSASIVRLPMNHQQVKPRVDEGRSPNAITLWPSVRRQAASVRMCVPRLVRPS